MTSDHTSNLPVPWSSPRLTLLGSPKNKYPANKQEHSELVLQALQSQPSGCGFNLCMQFLTYACSKSRVGAQKSCWSGLMTHKAATMQVLSGYYTMSEIERNECFELVMFVIRLLFDRELMMSFVVHLNYRLLFRLLGVAVSHCITWCQTQLIVSHPLPQSFVG